MQYLRYVWPLLLLIAAVLAPDASTAVILAIGGLLNLTLVLLREKRMNRLVNELNHLLSLSPQPQSVALERSLAAMRRQLLTLAVLAQSVIFIALLLGLLDITIARNYALLVLVALAPLGLEAELAILVRKHHTKNSETVRTAVGFAIEDARVLLVVLGLSFVGTVWLHIPPALSALQILFITCVARPLLSGRALQSLAHKTERAWRVVFASAIVYGTFIFFFIRHYINPTFADSTNPITWQATTCAMLAFIGCQAILIAFNPSFPRRAMWRLGALLVTLLAICYLPGLHEYFSITGPKGDDWAWILIGSLVFAALCLLRYHLSTHSRKAVLGR